jgi:2-polyprenyl-3-methyl-5-hydroxy-6-metoxy-1,4-benzoquinol methylase
MAPASQWPAHWKDWFGRTGTIRLQRRILPHLRWNQKIWGETIRRYLTPSIRWLDAGCGWRLLGKDLEALETDMVSLPRMTVGVDLDLPHLRKHLNISRRALASLDSLPFADSSFDLITCNMVAEHLPAPLITLRELTRVLSPGGVLMVHTPNTRNYLVLANVFAKKLLPRPLLLRLLHDGRAPDDIFPTYYRANTTRTLRHLGRTLGLEPEFVRCLTHPQPFTRAFAPLALFELLLMRVTMTAPFDRFATTILIVFRKRAVTSTQLAPAA